MELSVVVPVYNEYDNIAPLVGEIKDALEGRFRYEIIYVDDGSTDETLGRLRTVQKDVRWLRILHHLSRCGQSTALRTGIRAARAPWIATLDGDGQNDPADIVFLAETREKTNDPRLLGLLAGWRNVRHDRWVRRLSSRVANAVRATALGDRTPDTGCGLKLFRRDVYLELPYFDHMHRFLPALVQRAGWNVISVKVTHRPRIRGASKYGIANRLWVGIIDLVGVMWLMRRARNPQVNEVT
jgi:dolichol-phosphate mannosyltransferase